MQLLVSIIYTSRDIITLFNLSKFILDLTVPGNYSGTNQARVHGALSIQRLTE